MVHGIRTLLAFIPLVLVGASSSAQSHAPLIIILVPELQSSDLTCPELWGYDIGGGMRAHGFEMLLSKSAIGWMNCRTARVPGQREDPQEAAYVTLGAGARATAGPYARTVGPEPLSLLTTENAKLDHPVQIGALGDLIHAAGCVTTVAGNEDDVEPRRAGLWVLADSRGSVDHCIEGVVDRDPATGQPATGEPFGLRSALSAFEWPSKPGDVALWYYGDLARAGRYSRLCVPELADKHRSRALKNLTALLMKTVISEFHQEGPAPNVILLSVPGENALGDRLAPLIMWGPDVTPGLLTSGSTHTPGLVTNTDFLPTVASLLRLKMPAEMIGRPMTVVPVPRKLSLWQWLQQLARLKTTPVSPRGGPTVELWAKLHDDWYSNSRQQTAFGGLPTIQALTVAFTMGLGLLAGRTKRLSAALPLALLWLPLVLLLLPAVAPTSVPAAAALLGITVAMPVLVGAFRPGSVRALAAFPLAALVMVTIFDLLVGTPLMRQAWMSYSVMEGARYYGIGNEYCGALLAAGLASAVLVGRLPAWVRGTLLAALTLLVGWPAAGANAGGFLGLAIGVGVASVVWLRGKLRLRDALILLLLIVVGMGAVLCWDSVRAAESQTHIARAIHGGPWAIIRRKAELNTWLLTHSPWSLALLGSVTGLIFAWRRRVGVLRLRAAADPRLAGALSGIAAGAIALLVLNDSGVVAAAECLVVAWAMVQVISAEDQRPQTSPASSA